MYLILTRPWSIRMKKQRVSQIQINYNYKQLLADLMNEQK